MGSILKYGLMGAAVVLAIGVGAVMLVVGLAYRPESKTAQAAPTVRAVATSQATSLKTARPDPTLVTYEGVTESRLREELDKLSKGGSMADPVPFGTPRGFLVDHQGYAVGVTFAKDVLDMVKDDPLQKPPIGYSALAIGVMVAYVDGPQGRPLRLSERDFQIVANKRLWEDPPLGKAVFTPFGSVALVPGGSHNGLLPTKFVSQGLVDEALLMHKGVYFSLKEPQS